MGIHGLDDPYGRHVRGGIGGRDDLHGVHGLDGLDSTGRSMGNWKCLRMRGIPSGDVYILCNLGKGSPVAMSNFFDIFECLGLYCCRMENGDSRGRMMG